MTALNTNQESGRQLSYGSYFRILVWSGDPLEVGAPFFRILASAKFSEFRKSLCPEQSILFNFDGNNYRKVHTLFPHQTPGEVKWEDCTGRHSNHLSCMWRVHWTVFLNILDRRATRWAWAYFGACSCGFGCSGMPPQKRKRRGRRSERVRGQPQHDSFSCDKLRGWLKNCSRLCCWLQMR